MSAGEGLTVYVPFASGYFEFPEDYGKYFEEDSVEASVEEEKIDLNQKTGGTMQAELAFDDFEIGDVLILVKWGIGILLFVVISVVLSFLLWHRFISRLLIP